MDPELQHPSIEDLVNWLKTRTPETTFLTCSLCFCPLAIYYKDQIPDSDLRISVTLENVFIDDVCGKLKRQQKLPRHLHDFVAWFDDEFLFPDDIEITHEQLLAAIEEVNS